jgi:hypothetical protein
MVWLYILLCKSECIPHLEQHWANVHLDKNEQYFPLEHRYSIPHLVPWLCLGILGLRLCRFIAEVEPPRCIPMQSIGTRRDEGCTDVLGIFKGLLE